jgi:TatD DNase family protein
MRTPKNSLVDTHCHLSLKEFNEDREAVIQRAHEAGVRKIVVPGVDLDSSRKAVEYAENFPSLFAAVGIHPHYADGWDQSTASELAGLAKSEKVVAIGEIGLDFYRNYSPREEQFRAFQSQLELAADLELPVIVHNRESIREILDILIPWSEHLESVQGNRSGVLHAYSGTTIDAIAAIKAGFFLGIAGPISYKNAVGLQRVASELPIERILVETDSPYLAPHPVRGKRNEPAYVSFVVEHLSRIIREDIENTSRQTSLNAAVLFGWDHGTD